MLVNPPFLENYSRQSRSPCVAKSGTIYYAYYLAYAGCALELSGFSVVHFDAIVERLNHKISLERIADEAPDLVIIDTSTPSIVNDIEFARDVKNRLPNCVIGMVGTFPSKNTSEFFALCQRHGSQVDVVLRGEYEASAVELAYSVKKGTSYRNIEGVAFLDDGVVVESGKAQQISEDFLESLPFVSEYYLRHFGEEGIKRHFYASINWPYIQILTSRGCPYKCSFCNIPSIGSYRKRSIKSVVDEFSFIATNMSFVKEIFIEDDTFPIDKKRTIQLCNELRKLNLNITWSCNARVNTDAETLKAMHDAGCRLTCVGFESPSADGLTGIIKRTSLDQQESFMMAANEAGMKVNGCFILGLPGDNKNSINETIQYSIRLQPNTAQFYPHMLYPGTGSFDWAESEGLLAHKDWSKWLTNEGFHNTPLRLPDMSSEELLEKCDEARLRFYTNPRYLFRMAMQSITSWKEAQRMFIAGKKFFPLLFSYVKKRLWG